MAIPMVPTFPIEPATSPVAEVVCRILVEPDNERDAEPIGTGVWVAENLVLTARHNVDYIIREYGPPNSAGYAIRLYNILPGPEYAIWQVNCISTSQHSDLALLQLGLHGYTGDTQPGSNIAARIRLLFPYAKERVAGFGYHNMEATFSRNADGSLHLELLGVPQTTTGTVVEVYERGRDRGLYSFPCFQVNARFNAGMSGGPVFDDSGSLIGVISGSLPPDADGGEHVSYVAAIWPILEMAVPRSGQPNEEVCSVRELAMKGVVQVTDIPRYLRDRQRRGAS